DIGSLWLGFARTLHLPGELFVEYQLAAAASVLDVFVATAAYGDLVSGYIGTKVAYGQGGYETGPVSRVASEVEDVLFPAMCTLLDTEQRPGCAPSDITATASRLSSKSGT